MPPIKSPLLTGLPIVFGFRLACGDVYHVSPEGKAEGNGSYEHPFASIQQALDECSPGDSVLVHKGTYRERVFINTSGKPGKWLTLMGEPGAVLSGKGLKGEALVLIENQSYVRVMNLEFTENEGRNETCAVLIQGSGSHIEVRNCKVTNCKGRNARGIHVYGTHSQQPYSNIVVDGNEISDCEPAPSEALTINGNVTDFAVTNNYIHDVNNIGIDFIGGEADIVKDRSKAARNGICEGNRVFRARANYGGGFGAGIYVDGARDIIIQNNIVSECDLGIEVGAENKGSVAQRIKVRDNIIYKNDKAGIVFGGYDATTGRVTDCEFTGNILYHNSQGKKGVAAEIWIQYASGNVLKKNIIWAAKDKAIITVELAGKSNTLEENQWYADSPADAVLFHYDEEDQQGFETYRKLSGFDATSKWAKPTFPDPEKGKFRD